MGRAGGVLVEADGEGRRLRNHVRGSRFEVRGLRFAGSPVRAQVVVGTRLGWDVEVGPEAELDGVLTSLPLAGFGGCGDFAGRLLIAVRGRLVERVEQGLLGGGDGLGVEGGDFGGGAGLLDSALGLGGEEGAIALGVGVALGDGLARRSARQFRFVA